MVNKELSLSVKTAETSAIATWLKSENVFFSSILEGSVTNRQVCLMPHASLAFMALAGSAFKKLFQKVCGLKNNPHICSAQHLIQARRLAKIFAAGIFYVHGYTYSSVPCGALMRPQPVSGVEQRGAELFLFPSVLNQHNVSF